MGTDVSCIPFDCARVDHTVSFASCCDATSGPAPLKGNDKVLTDSLQHFPCISRHEVWMGKLTRKQGGVGAQRRIRPSETKASQAASSARRGSKPPIH